MNKFEKIFDPKQSALNFAVTISRKEQSTMQAELALLSDAKDKKVTVFKIKSSKKVELPPKLIFI